MARFMNHNANPQKNRVGDCVVRAISKATNTDWETTMSKLFVFSVMAADMPSANHVWGQYLKSLGFKRYCVDDHDKEWYSVIDFCNDHPRGTYILALSSHVVCAIDGVYFDTWDCGSEVPIYYWCKEEDKK